MLTHRNVCAPWLLLLLHVSGTASQFNLFKSKAEPQEGDVRLAGSKRVSEGRVEIYHAGKWGTVCDDGWGPAQSEVVCRQLHFPGAKSILSGNAYGEAAGPIWMDDVDCDGTENHLLTCRFKGWALTDCTHKEDVAIDCETAGTGLTTSDAINLLDHSFSLSDDLDRIFKSEAGCDFLIFVRSATGSQRQNGTVEKVENTICAHKMILSKYPFFNATGHTSNITLEVSQACQPYFSSFIRYMYTRKIDVTMSSVQCLHWMASRFGVKQLMEGAGQLFSKVLPEDPLFHTQVSIHRYAQETEDLVLQENCVQFLAWNYENLTKSPAWAGLSQELLAAILVRSDLVAPDEYFVLQTVERWISQRAKSLEPEKQASLLNCIRFPMIPAEKLYDIEANSSLYDAHKGLYRGNLLRAYQFNVLLLSNLLSSAKFNTFDVDLRPRIYTAPPWSAVIGPDPGAASKYFHTPIHTSRIFKGTQIQWEANVFRRQQECSNRGLHCKSLPMARLYSYNRNIQGNVTFRTDLLLVCRGQYVSQVQDFKVNLVHVAKNGTQVLAYPCPDDKYTYRFVVRAEYF